MGNNPLVWALLAIVVLFLIAMIIFALSSPKKKRKTDYYNLFIMGIIFLLFGIIVQKSAFFFLGIVFMAAGLAHKKEWKKNHRSWKQLSKREKKIQYILMAVLLILLIATIAVIYLARKGIYC